MPVNIDAARKKLKEVKERSEGGPFWTPESGSNKLRILPPVGKMKDEFWKEGGMHFNLGSNNDYALCPQACNGDPCPVCEMVDAMFKSGDKAEVKAAKRMKVKMKYWMNIIDRADPARGPQVYGAPITVFKEILSYVADPDYGDITDPKSGRDIVLEKTGASLDTEYNVRARPKTSSIKASMYKKALDLSSWEKLQPPEYDELAELIGAKDTESDEVEEEELDEEDLEEEDEDLEEEEDEDIEEDDDEDIEEDDDEDDEEDDEEEDEEEELDDEDEEEEELDEEEEEEEEPPKKRSRKKGSVRRRPSKKSSKKTAKKRRRK